MSQSLQTTLFAPPRPGGMRTPWSSFRRADTCRALRTWVSGRKGSWVHKDIQRTPMRRQCHSPPKSSERVLRRARDHRGCVVRAQGRFASTDKPPSMGWTTMPKRSGHSRLEVAAPRCAGPPAAQPARRANGHGLDFMAPPRREGAAEAAKKTRGGAERRLVPNTVIYSGSDGARLK